MDDELRYKGQWHFSEDSLRELDSAIDEAERGLIEVAKRHAFDKARDTLILRGVEEPNENAVTELADKLIQNDYSYQVRDAARTILVRFSDRTSLTYHSFAAAANDPEAATRDAVSFRIDVSRGKHSYRFDTSGGVWDSEASVSAGPSMDPEAVGFRDACRRALQRDRLPHWQQWLKRLEPAPTILCLIGALVCIWAYAAFDKQRFDFVKKALKNEMRAALEGGVDESEYGQVLELIVRHQASIYPESSIPDLPKVLATYPMVGAGCLFALGMCAVFATPKTRLSIGKGADSISRDRWVASVAKWIATTVVLTGFGIPLVRHLIF